MTARTVRRAADRSEQNRRAVNQHRNGRNEGGFSRRQWQELDAAQRSRLVESLAGDALSRVDDGGQLHPGDRAALEVFDRHLVWEAFIPPEPLCRHGQTADCNSCFLDHDDLMRRLEDQ